MIPSIEITKENDVIVLISDIHFGVRINSIEWQQNITSYFDKFFIPFLEKIKKKGNNPFILICGDLFDNRQQIDVQIINIVMDLFEKLRSYKVVMMTGNHDISRKNDTGITSLRLLKLFDNVTILQKPTMMNFWNGKKGLIVPWVGDPKAENKILMDNPAELIFMHSDINGLKYDNGRDVLNGVNSELVDKSTIYSGHIHKMQKINNVVYLGSPYQMKRSDIGNTKGIYYLDIKDDGFKENFTINTYSPKFIKVKIEDILDKTLPEISKMFKNNYVDIIIKSRYFKKFSISKFMDAVENSGFKKIEIIEDKREEEMMGSPTIESMNMSFDEIVGEYIKRVDGIEDSDREELMKLNSTYLKNGEDILNKEV